MCAVFAAKREIIPTFRIGSLAIWSTWRTGTFRWRSVLFCARLRSFSCHRRARTDGHTVSRDAVALSAAHAFLPRKEIRRIRAIAQNNSLPRHPKTPFATRKRREIAAMDETAAAAKGFSFSGAD